MSATPAHDWLAPRLESLLEDAGREGIARDTAVAVLLDLLETGPAPGPPPGSPPGSQPTGAETGSGSVAIG